MPFGPPTSPGHRLRLDTDFALHTDSPCTPPSPGLRLRPPPDSAWTPTSPGHRLRPDTDFARTPTSPGHRLRPSTPDLRHWLPLLPLASTFVLGHRLRRLM